MFSEHVEDTKTRFCLSIQIELRLIENDSCSRSEWYGDFVEGLVDSRHEHEGTDKWLVLSVASFAVRCVVFSDHFLHILLRCVCLVPPQRVASSWIHCILLFCQLS